MLKKYAAFFVFTLVSFGLAGATLLTVWRIGQSERPVAPTAPESRPQAIEGNPAANCTIQFSVPALITSPSPSPLVTPSPTPVPSPTPSPTLLPTPTPITTPTPGPTVTPSPSPVVSCQYVKIYQVIEGSWILVQNPLQTLLPGDTVYFAVLGSASDGIFDRARFRINGLPVDWVESTLTNPSGEFYYAYTLLPGIHSYTLEAQVHHVVLGWY